MLQWKLHQDLPQGQSSRVFACSNGSGGAELDLDGAELDPADGPMDPAALDPADRPPMDPAAQPIAAELDPADRPLAAELDPADRPIAAAR